MKRFSDPEKSSRRYPTKKELAVLVKTGIVVMAAGALASCSQQRQDEARTLGGVSIQKGK